MQLAGSTAMMELREDAGMHVSSAPDEGLEGLMSGYQQGDEGAATALIEKVSPMLLRFFWMQAFGRRYADDLVQETWMRIHKARHTYRPGEPVLPWIFAIARHTRVDSYRKTRRVEIRETQVEVLPEIATAQETAQDTAAVDSMLGALPESQREVLVMLKVCGMTIEEVARATSSSIGSVKQKAHRAYATLRGALIGGARGT
jgi:RNA polymerase sigma-70 factor (ECF subfamily)